MQTIAIYGGAFDPVHKAHIATALSIQSVFHFDKIIFIPCKETLLKAAASANSAQRVAMLELALKEHPSFSIDLREINRKTPSFMVETLQSFRTEFPNSSITLILGEDAWSQLPKWHLWENILQLANLLIMKRPGGSGDGETKVLQKLLEKHGALLPKDITNHKAGKIIQFDAGNYKIASRDIRTLIKMGGPLEAYLPSAVIAYIRDEKLYSSK